MAGTSSWLPPDRCLPAPRTCRCAAAQAPQAGPPPAQRAPADEDHQAEEAARIEAGARCEVEGGRRGVVRYVGRVDGLPLGYWVGVQVCGLGG